MAEGGFVDLFNEFPYDWAGFPSRDSAKPHEPIDALQELNAILLNENISILAIEEK